MDIKQKIKTVGQMKRAILRVKAGKNYVRGYLSKKYMMDGVKQYSDSLLLTDSAQS